MGYDLTSQGDGSYFRFSIHGWPKILEIAERYGWQKAGTAAPSPEPLSADDPCAVDEWDGSYMHNCGQIVSREDAWNLAAALESALDDIPDTRSVPDWIVFSREPLSASRQAEEIATVKTRYGDHTLVGFKTLSEMDKSTLSPISISIFTQLSEAGEEALIVAPNYYASLMETFSGEYKQRIVDFIAYCRLGGFSIL